MEAPPTSFRRRRHSSGPSTPGIIQSVSRTSMPPEARTSQALDPSSATTHSCPSFDTIALRSRRLVGSSSAMRIFTSALRDKEHQGHLHPGEFGLEPFHQRVGIGELVGADEFDLAGVHLQFGAHARQVVCTQVRAGTLEGMRGVGKRGVVTLAQFAAEVIAPLPAHRAVLADDLGEGCPGAVVEAEEQIDLGAVEWIGCRAHEGTPTGPETESSCSPSGVAWEPTHRASTVATISSRTGFVMKSSMPDARQASRSPSIAAAVMAMIGVRRTPSVSASMRRMAPVAS